MRKLLITAAALVALLGPAATAERAAHLPTDTQRVEAALDTPNGIDLNLMGGSHAVAKYLTPGGRDINKVEEPEPEALAKYLTPSGRDINNA